MSTQLQPPSAPLLSDRAADRDLLDFTPYTQTLLDIIRDPNTQGPLVIGLFGTWGSGKTSLMQFVRDDLSRDVRRRFRLAWFDAWKYEKEDALWRALLLRVVDNLRDRDDKGADVTLEPLKSDIARLEQRLYRDVEWEEKGGLTVDLPKLGKAAAAGAIKLSFAMLPGFATEVVKAAQAALGKAEGTDEFLAAFDRNVIEHHQAQLRSIEQFQREFEKVVAERIVAQGERLVVFVDDLDRCLPEKAIEVLEAIKLFLDVKGCIFLLGLDEEVVTRGIKVKYRDFAVTEPGSENRIPIDGAAYLEKIIQLPFRLPRIEPDRMKPFIIQAAPSLEARCADVFAVGLQTNPRKVKRAVNVFLFLDKLAQARRLAIQPVRLAKVVVIYHSHQLLYKQLSDNPAHLRNLEEYINQKTTAAPRDPSLRSGQAPSTGSGARALKMPGEEIAERSAQGAPAVSVPQNILNLLTPELEQVLALFPNDADACFSKLVDAEGYDELKAYFTLTRGAIVEPPAGTGAASAARAALPFPVPTFVSVPAGEFRMGTSDAEIEQLLKMKETKDWAAKWKQEGSFKAEQPQHRVTLDAFQIGKYPVTNAEYQAFVKETNRQPPSHWSGGTFAEELSAHPVVNVAWEDATAYCEWLTEKLRIADFGFRKVESATLAPHASAGVRDSKSEIVVRLPTEAEWEKAAAWDDEKKVKRIWPWGNEWDAAKCNTAEGKAGGTTPVGKYSPGGDSPYGIADMAGNVWEWCADWYDADYYEKNPPEKNPQGPSSGELRVLRGGSWFSPRDVARCAFRDALTRFPDFWYFFVGFRCARSFSA